MNETPDVSVIITTYNQREFLANAISSLKGHTTGVTYEIIVVDDASTDGTYEFIRQLFPDIKIRKMFHNVGFAKANNQGVVFADGRYILLLNNDTIFASNALKIFVDYMDSHPNTGVCGGRLLLPSTYEESNTSYGSFPTIGQAMIDALFLNDLFPKWDLPNRGVSPDPAINSPRKVDYITGANMFIRTNTVHDFNLFDELFWAYCEDTDFCKRTRVDLGMDTVYVPEAKIYHFGGHSFIGREREQIWLMYSSYDKYLTKWYSRTYSLSTRCLYAFRSVVRLVIRTGLYLSHLNRSTARKKQREKLTEIAWAIRYAIHPGDKPL